MIHLKLRIYYLLVAFIREKTNNGSIKHRAEQLLKDIDERQEKEYDKAKT